VSVARDFIVGLVGTCLMYLDVSLALCRSVDRIFWGFCADPVPLLSLGFGWLHGVNDRVNSGKHGSWSEL